jgi:hypothetical protein
MIYRKFSSAGGLPAGISRRASLQSVYSRRWKNTAVYGASQVQTTISCIFDAFWSHRVTNTGFSLWKALSSRLDAVVSAQAAPKTVQILT